MTSAIAARDAALTRVAENNERWMAEALWRLKDMRHEYNEATGEMMRYWLRRNGIGEPSTPHAWGALVRQALDGGLIADTGRVMKMSTKKSHARRTPVWRFL